MATIKIPVDLPTKNIQLVKDAIMFHDSSIESLTNQEALDWASARFGAVLQGLVDKYEEHLNNQNKVSTNIMDE